MKSLRTCKALLIVPWLMAVALGQQSPSPTPPPAETGSSQVTVDATKQWVDTNIDLKAGEKVRFSATGHVAYPQQGKSKERTFGPDGLTRGFSDVIHQYAVGDAGHGALVARLGAADAGQPFLVGASKEFVAPISGRLFLGIN